MSFGFKIFDGAGAQTLSSDNFGFSLLDKFVVSPSSSGSRTYADMSEFSIFTSQTQVEPAVTTRNAVLAFNNMNVSVTHSGTSTTVTWSPRISSVLAADVIIYVMVM